MKKFITANGFEGYTYQEYLTIVQDVFKTALGEQDLDFNSNTAFGQIANIFAQFFLDQQTQLQDVYNLSFSRNNATGINLDLLGDLFRIPRKGGSYTQQEIQITTNAIVKLQGLDGSSTNQAFTVGDGNGLNFALVNSTFTTNGVNTLLFQASDFGVINPAINTLTKIITIQSGVLSANNPQPALSIGALEETDASYKIRQIKSTKINSSGFVASITARLNAIENLTNSIVLENFTNTTDANGLVAHSIQVIVEGGSDEDVANAIYNTKPPGTNMNGAEQFIIKQPSGVDFIAKFDRATTLTLYLQCNLKNNSGTALDLTKIKQEFVKKVSFELNQPAASGRLTGLLVDTLEELGIANVFVSSLRISQNNVNFVDLLETPLFKNKWGLTETNIVITLI